MMRGFFTSCAIIALLLAAAWADGHDPGQHLGHGQGHGQHHGHGHDHGQHRGHHRPGHGHGQHRGHGHGHGQRRGHHRPGHPHYHHHSHEEDMICHKVSDPNAIFAFALYKKLNAKAAAGKNIFFSPLGISTALSMLSTGAHAETHKQLFSSLGYGDLQQTQVNEAYKQLLHMLGHSQEDQQLSVANGLVLQGDFTPLAAFQKDVRKDYSGEIFQVDFKKQDQAAAEVNGFIANKTDNKITDQVKDLDPDTVMMLINSVYFKGQWATYFNPEKTKKANFTVDENTVVQVDMMMTEGKNEVVYGEGVNATLVRFRYKGNTSMIIVLPDEGKMKEVEGIINKDLIHQWQDSFVPIPLVSVVMPKFTISTEASLVDTLKEMGVTDAFGDVADFSGISNDIKLNVSEVSHKAVLSLDEKGAEAADYTVDMFVPYYPMTMYVELNRPFLVFVLEESTRSILFMGKINNPNDV